MSGPRLRPRPSAGPGAARLALAAALAAGLAGPAAADASADAAPVSSGLTLETWPVLPEALASFGAAEADGWVYVYGGHRGPVHAHAREHVSPLFLRLSRRDGRTLEALPPGPPLQGLALVAHAGAVLRVGGLEARNAAGAPEDLHSTAEVARFDPVRRTWTPLPPLPEPRSSLDAAVLGDRLYVVGGWSLAGERAPFLPGGWSLDLRAAAPAWTRVAPLPVARRALALVAAGGRLLALGGITDDGQLSARVDVYDPAADAWTEGPALPFHGFGCAAAAVGDVVYASGQDSDLWRLPAAPGAGWERAGSLAFPRYFHRLVPWGPDRLLALGGSGSDGHLRVAEPLPVVRGGARAAVLELPVPFRAKNRQAVVVHGDALLLAGGNDGLEQHDFSPPRFVTEAWRLDLGALAAAPQAPLPEARQTLAAALVPGRRPAKDRAYAVGGFANPGDGARAQREVFELDPGRGWKALGALLPAPRTQLGLVAHEGALWVLGGVDYDARRPRGEAFRFPLEVLRWRPGEPAFAAAGALPRARRAAGCAALDGKAWLVGGMRDGFQLVPEVDVLDLETGAWATGPAPARARVSPELVAFRGRLWLAGGSSLPRPDAGPGEVEEDRTVEVLDPGAGAWAPAWTLPAPTRHASLHAWRDRLLLYSAHVEDGRAVRVVVLDPAPRPGDDLRRGRERVVERRRRHEALRAYLAAEQAAWEEEAAGKPAPWAAALAAHREVVAAAARLVARGRALEAELAGLAAEPPPWPVLARVEGASHALGLEAHDLREEHERLEGTLDGAE